jgi:hypothetical protein
MQALVRPRLPAGDATGTRGCDAPPGFSSRPTAGTTLKASGRGGGVPPCLLSWCTGHIASASSTASPSNAEPATGQWRSTASRHAPARSPQAESSAWRCASGQHQHVALRHRRQPAGPSGKGLAPAAGPAGPASNPAHRVSDDPRPSSMRADASAEIQRPRPRNMRRAGHQRQPGPNQPQRRRALRRSAVDASGRKRQQEMHHQQRRPRRRQAGKRAKPAARRRHPLPPA